MASVASVASVGRGGEKGLAHLSTNKTTEGARLQSVVNARDNPATALLVNPFLELVTQYPDIAQSVASRSESIVLEIQSIFQVVRCQTAELTELPYGCVCGVSDQFPDAE